MSKDRTMADAHVRKLAAHLGVIASLAFLTTSAGAAPATDAAGDFYKGKQIHLIVSSGPAGGYNTYARLVAQYMPAHIPGNPAMIVQNMEGASGIKATSYMFN